ncbi:MAG: cyclic nucleotide-binding domain-containing protein [Pseudomonadota bacterium]
MELTHELLAKFAPFNTLPFEYLNQIIEKASIKTFEKGAIVFKRGRELNEVFYLLEGNVDLIDAQFAVESISSEEELYRFALHSPSPTLVSAIAKSAVTVLMVERDFLDLVMAWSESGNDEDSEDLLPEGMEEGDWMSSLLASPLFNKIPPGNIRQLFIRFKSHKTVADEVVLREGERGDYFYVLESGSATVLDKQGNLLAALRPGDYFGEEALVGDTTRNATVKMLTAGKLMRLVKEDFITLLQEPVRRFISFEELQENIAKKENRYQILDVRLALERRFQSVPNSRNIPLNQLRKVLPQLEVGIIYVIADDAGRRTDVAAQLLNQAGFDALILKDANLHQNS